MSRVIKFRAWHLDVTGVHTMHHWDQVKNSFKEYLRGSELMQFTGLKDKNGVDIYEGDIVEYDSSHQNYIGCWGVGVVERIFKSSDLGFFWHKQRTETPSIFSACHYFGCAKELKVLGNIHEHPRLLEQST